MKIAYFDCIGGASGDMILGSLVDAGISVDFLREKFAKLHISGWSLEKKKVVKHGIAAMSIEVAAKEQIALRTMATIKSALKKSSLSKLEIEESIGIFKRLGEAEAKVHGTTLENVHFHEVGAIDTIIDIVGAVCGLRFLGIDRVIVSPFPIGKAGPAAFELFKNFPVYGIEEQKETVTPTGAAILTTLAGGVGRGAERLTFLPPCVIESVGYGAGKFAFQSRPNVLRLVIGESYGLYENLQTGMRTEVLALLEANIDDANPQVYDYVSERLFKNGALDVWLTPIHMKKNRPAVTLSVLCKVADEQKLSGIVFEEGLTLGIRRQRIDRMSLPRERKTIKTKFGNVRVKMAQYKGKIVRAMPEYEDCKKIAKKQGVSLRAVSEAASDFPSPD
jgi:uncharacterized protein (TIGR00299 family) protein